MLGESNIFWDFFVLRFFLGEKFFSDVQEKLKKNISFHAEKKYS